MGTTDPRLLIQALGDLEEEGQRWSATGWSTIRDVTDYQKRAMAQVEHAQRRSRVILTQRERDLEKVRSLRRQAEALADICKAAKQNADEMLARTQQAETDAQNTLVFWQSELQAAREWLARAKERLAEAQAELRRAEQILHQAEMELSRAYNRLSACQNDKDRRNCNAERAAVATAQAYVAEAQALVRLAVAEVQAAEEEVRQAEARVRCCERAVGLAEQAVDRANRAMEHAGTSVVEAERSLEYVAAIWRFLQSAEVHAQNGSIAGEEMVEIVGLANHQTDEAERYRFRADEYMESAQRVLLTCRRELQYRIEQLQLLNRSELGGILGVIVSRIAGGAAGRSVAAFLPTFRSVKVPSALVLKKTGNESLWSPGNVSRGRDYEELNGANIGGNYPVIDDFRNGVATSFKTIDLRSPSYQTSIQVTQAVSRYVNKLNGFAGRKWGNGICAPEGQIRVRVLDIGIPLESASKEQQRGLREASAYARSKGISVLIKEVP